MIYNMANFNSLDTLPLLENKLICSEWNRNGMTATIVLSSTARAAEYQGHRLGEFVEAGEHGGRPYFVQRDSEGKRRHFLYSEGGEWTVGYTLGKSSALNRLRNFQNTNTPPSTQWKLYLFADGGKWIADSLTLEFTTLSPICQLVRVAGEGDVVKKQGSSLGDYRLEEGRWSAGRPVFKKVDGERRFLLVKEGRTTWAISSSTTGTGTWIESGRATNSPASPEAGPTVRLGRTRWKYWDSDSSGWKEGDISVTCL